MKTTMLLALLALSAGCASYGTQQADIRREFYQNGKLKSETKITTDAAAKAFFSSRQELSKFKASQTEKSQSIGGSGLEQQGATNFVESLREVKEIIQTIPK